MFKRPLIAFLVIAFGVLVPAAIAQAIVPEQPRRDTPIVLDGEVWDVEQIGQQVVVAGNFTQVQITRGGATVTQPGLFSYDANTGEFNADFRPIIRNNGGDPEVLDLEAAADGRSVYLGGRFTTIDDQTDGRVRFRTRMALIDTINGRVDRNFAQSGVNAKVQTIERFGDDIYFGGNFVTVYDKQSGSQINRPVRGMIRVNAATGAYDQSFRYESRNDIGRDGTFGVSNIEMRPDGRRLVVAHRGAEIFDVARGTTTDAGGLAIISMNTDGQSHSVTGFEALYPDPNDPIQEFFHAGQCNDRGTQIRDMEVSPDGQFIVLVSQGADLGFQCDTITRFPLSDSPSRPTWVSRAFDSVFAVGIADDAIYVGGHFRYLVHPSAPSAYPGDNGPNGERPPRGQWYIADPEDDRPAAIEFVNDLLNPGYVYPANQIGALSISTGKGIPSWEPGSDAFKGVLALTVTERGLLLGQDNGRVNGIFTGRSAFFDDNPNAGNPNCQVALNAGGRPVISWVNPGGVSSWDVVGNGTVVGSTTGTSLTDTASAAGTTVSYELRYVRGGTNQVAPCGSVSIPNVSFTCTAQVVGDDVQISWNDQGFTRVAVRRDGSYRAMVRNGGTSFVDSPGVGTFSYALRGFVGTTRFDAACGSVTIDDGGNGGPTCTATIANGQVTLNWTDVGASEYQIRRNGSWRAGVTGTTYTEPNIGASYIVRYWQAGSRNDIACG